MDFDAYVRKPVKASVLHSTLMSVFNRGSDPHTDVGTSGGKMLEISDALVSGKKKAFFSPTNAPTMDGEMGKAYPLRILIAEDNVINQKVVSPEHCNVSCIITHGCTGSSYGCTHEVMGRPTSEWTRAWSHSYLSTGALLVYL